MGGQRSQRAIFSISAFCQSLYYTIHHTLLYTLKYLSPYSNLHLLVTYTLKYLTITDNPPAVTRQILTNIKGFPPGRSARSSLHISGVGGNNVLLYLTFVELSNFSPFFSTTPGIRGLTRSPPPDWGLTSGGSWTPSSWPRISPALCRRTALALWWRPCCSQHFAHLWNKYLSYKYQEPLCYLGSRTSAVITESCQPTQSS